LQALSIRFAIGLLATTIDFPVDQGLAGAIVEIPSSDAFGLRPCAVCSAPADSLAAGQVGEVLLDSDVNNSGP
jgi:hypothetical protein